MSNKKQTSIEWLWEQIKNSSCTYDDIEKLIEQAKEMHKQEILSAYKEGHYHLEYDSFNPENYYNEKYKQ
jgi:hypothetical protein